MAKYRVTSPDGVTFEVTAPDDATPDQVQAYAQQNMPKPEQAAPTTRMERLKTPEMQAMLQRELLASPPVAVARGLKDIVDTGAQGLAWLYDKATGSDKPTLESLVTGSKQGEAARVAAMNKAGQDEFAAATDGQILPSIARVGGNLAVTSPILTRAGAAIATQLPRFGNAVATGGFSTGAAPAVGKAAKAADLAIRTAGGGAAGFAGAGMVDPEKASEGGLIGAVLPGAVQLAGNAGRAVGKAMSGPKQSPDLVDAIKNARSAGYVIPPTQAKPTLGNRIIEGFSGKITTAQNASARNQQVTNNLAAKEVGLPENTPITLEALDAVRAEAGKAYAEIAKLGKFDATRATLPAAVKVEHGISPLLAGKTKTVDAAELVRAWKQANHDATGYYRAYGRDANPETLAKAKAAASDAKKIDDFMMQRVNEVQAKKPEKLIADLVAGRIDQTEFVGQAMTIGNKKSMTQALKDARVRIAKTYSIESAMNPLTGSVDARKLAKQLEKGKALSGGLKDAASFAARFPKAAQAVEGMGSLPQTSPLDWHALGATSMATGNPFLMLGTAARPLARYTALSPMVQNNLAQSGSNALSLAGPDLQRLLLRAGPTAIANGQ